MDNLPERKLLRLKDYDYSQPGYYFVTICSNDKSNLFGEIVGADDAAHTPVMQANHIGKIVYKCWDKINEIYEHVKTDEFCLMPNHFHGIIVINENSVQSYLPLQKIIQGFKSVTTRSCYQFQHPVIWQRGYYEHIIRNEQDLLTIKEYIVNNPAKWQEDQYHI